MCSTKPPNSRRFTGPTVKLGSSTTEAVSMSQPSDLVINPERRDAQMILVMVSTAAVNLPTAWSSSGPPVTGTRGPTEASLALTLHRYNGVAKALPPGRRQRATLSRSINRKAMVRDVMGALGSAMRVDSRSSTASAKACLSKPTVVSGGA